ncbi:MAG TPA: hypothetical protein V6D19_06525 [Stenomitos sp.]
MSQFDTLEDALAHCAMLALQRSEALRSLGRHSEAQVMYQVVSTIESLWAECDELLLK